MEKRFVVCVADRFEWWCSEDNSPSEIAPSKGDILEVVGFNLEDGICYLEFAEYPDNEYDSTNFRELTYGERVCESIERQPVKQLA